MFKEDSVMVSKSLRDTIAGADREGVEICSALMPGASRDEHGKLDPVDRSKLRLLLMRLGQLDIPVGQKLSAFQDLSQNPELQGVVKPLDLNPGTGVNEGRGGVDFFEYNPGVSAPDALVLCGIPKYPTDHDGDPDVLSYFGLSHLFKRSEYHHDEFDWFNLRQKVQQLAPKVVLCAGGDDCLSWQEVIGPGYIALKGESVNNGLLLSRAYLEDVAPYLIVREQETGRKNPLADTVYAHVLVYDFGFDPDNGVRLNAQPQQNLYSLWPSGL